jgi:hypothetical protein
MDYKNKALIAVFFLLMLLAVIYFLQTQKQHPVACTDEAMLCPDGSEVGRIAPDCRFAPCSNCTCPEGFIQEGATCNPKCYYSTPKCLTASRECNASGL